MGIRSLSAVLISVATISLSASAEDWTSRPADVIDAELAKGLTGKWTIKDKPESGLGIRFSKDHKTMFVKHETPYEFKGRKINLSRYHVLYSEKKSITMYLEGEDRRTDKGDRVIWVLTLDDKHSYHWRRTDLPVGKKSSTWTRVAEE